MNVPFYIARRYLFAKKSRLVNWVSGISTVSIMVGTAALILVLSVFNGLNSLIESLYNSFDPDLKIEVVEGKYFFDDEINISEIAEIKGVSVIVPVLEETVLLRYGDKQIIATIKGVGENFEKLTQLEEYIIDGNYFLSESGSPFAVVGYGIYTDMGINPRNPYDPIGFYAPKRGQTLNVLSPEAFSINYALPAGCFSTILEYDDKYIITSLDFAQSLIDAEEEISAIEIGLLPNANLSHVQKQIQTLAGSDFSVKNRIQQQEMYYKTIQSERLSIILILSFILLIATFNMIGSLLMVIYDKRSDIAILRSMGASTIMLRQIFWLEGLMIAFVGGFCGLFIGGGIALLQQYFGFLKLGGGEGFVVNAYPVQIQFSDFFLVFAIVLIVGLISSLAPLKKIK
ncbi:MAG: FtsX-like permease family protein [Bacteroidales bacterium]|nr:FtsX-like permease family protein [Bacteroidales bacterium]